MHDPKFLTPRSYPNLVQLPLATPLQLKLLVISTILHKRRQPFLQIFDSQILTSPLALPLRTAGLGLGWDQNVTNNLEDAVLGDAILHLDARKAVDLDLGEGAKAADIDGEVAVIEQGWEIKVKTGSCGCFLFLTSPLLHGEFVVLGLCVVVVCVRVEGMVEDDVVLEQCLEVLFAVFAEEESVDLGAEFLEGEVVRCEDSAADVGSGVQVVKKASLGKAKRECAEIAGKERKDDGDWRWWEEDMIHSVLITSSQQLQVQ